MSVTAQVVSAFKELLVDNMCERGGGSKKELTWKGHKGTFWDDGNFQYIDGVWVTKVYAFVKTH